MNKEHPVPRSSNLNGCICFLIGVKETCQFTLGFDFYVSEVVKTLNAVRSSFHLTLHDVKARLSIPFLFIEK